MLQPVAGDGSSEAGCSKAAALILLCLPVERQFIPQVLSQALAGCC